MRRPPGASVHNPVYLLELLFKSLSYALKSNGLKLISLVLQNGKLKFTIQNQGLMSHIVWQTKESNGVFVHKFGGFLSGLESKIDLQILHYLSSLLCRLDPELFIMFQTTDRLSGPQTYDKQTTERLFGPTLVVNKTKWADLVCTKITQTEWPPEITVAFGSEMHVCNIRIQLPYSAHPALVVSCMTCTASSVCRTRFGRPVDYIEFLLSRRLDSSCRFILPKQKLKQIVTHTLSEIPPPQTNNWMSSIKQHWYTFIHLHETSELDACRRIITSPHFELIFGERECHAPFAIFAGKYFPIYDHPIPNFWPGPSTYRRSTLCTVLTEAELTFGPNQKFNSMVKEVVDFAKKSAQNLRLFASSTCVSSLVGQDPDSLDLASRSGSQIVEVSDSPGLRSREVVRRLACLSKSENSPKFDSDKNSLPYVVLLGFPPTQGTFEIQQILEQAGICKTLRLIPELDEQAVTVLSKKKIAISLPLHTRQHEYKALQEELGIRLYQLPPPAGITGTSRWLQTVAELLSCKKNNALDQIHRIYVQKFEALRKCTPSIKIAIIANVPLLQTIADCKFTFGIPLFDLLLEAGFQIHLFLLRPEALLGLEGADRQATQFVLSKLKTRGLKVNWFSSQDELTSLLRKVRPNLALSDIWCDERLLRLGIARFSFSDFEFGYQGFIKTVKRLLSKAQSRFLSLCRDRDAG